jgi:hypothetical protein
MLDQLEGGWTAELGQIVVRKDEIPRLTLEGGAHGAGGLYSFIERLKATPAKVANDEGDIIFRVFDNQKAERPAPFGKGVTGGFAMTVVGFGYHKILDGPGGWRLIQDEPVESELASGLDKLLEIYGLTNIGVCAKGVAANDVFLLARRGEDHNRQESSELIGADFLKDFQAVELGEIQVEEHYLRKIGGITAGMGASPKEKVEGLGPVTADDYSVADVVLAEGTQRKRRIVGIILDK